VSEACLIRPRNGPYSPAVEFEILYCRICGYRERAEELAAELRQRSGGRVTVEEGGFGQFDVLLDGEVVASKGGFWKRMLAHGAPPQSEILEAIDRALADREGDICEITESR
jgi:selT/selW/selH-like putative selenoprotein